MLDARSFFLSLPHKVDPELLEGHQAVFHFDITDSGQFTVRIDNGKLDVMEGFAGEPKSTITTNQETFGKILSGDANPMWAMTTGKLKVTNPMALLEYARIFGLG